MEVVVMDVVGIRFIVCDHCIQWAYGLCCLKVRECHWWKKWAAHCWRIWKGGSGIDGYWWHNLYAEQVINCPDATLIFQRGNQPIKNSAHDGLAQSLELLRYVSVSNHSRKERYGKVKKRKYLVGRGLVVQKAEEKSWEIDYWEAGKNENDRVGVQR